MSRRRSIEHHGREQAGTVADRRCGRAREADRARVLVIEAMEESLGQGRQESRYGAEYDIRAQDRPEDRRSVTMTARADRGRRGREPLGRGDDASRMPRRIWTTPQVGNQIIDEQVPPMDFGRIAAQSAKQVIMQKVREAERASASTRNSRTAWATIINGLVKRVEYGNVIVDVGRGEAIVRRDQLINRESLSATGDRIRSPISAMSGPRYVARRSSSAARRRNSWRNCSRWKYPRSMTASSRSRPWPAIRAAARRSASCPTTTRSTRSGPVSGMRGSRVQAVVERASGREDRHHPLERGCRRPSWSTRCNRPRSAKVVSRRGCRADRGRGARRPA